MTTPGVRRSGTSRHLHVDMHGPRRSRLLPVSLLLLIVLGAGISCVWLRSRTQAVNKEIQKDRRTLGLKKKQLRNRSVELERFKSGEYIFSQVERLRLNIEPPDPGQVRRVTVRQRDDRAAGKEEPLVAGNMH